MSSRTSAKKGSRAGGYHVRTGCITCKIRHVKCDEEKPACLKCRSTGRTCDGYQGNTKKINRIETAISSINPDLKVAELLHARQLSITTSLSPSISGSAQERQCFEYFRFEIGKELSSALMLEPTHHFILQACHTDDAIKSAVIAIGSMGHRLRVNQLLTSENKQANELQAFAQVQYCKALKHLRARMLNDPARTLDLAIITCFLFTIFEFLQGDDEGALVHLRSGLNILRRENGIGGTSLGQDLLRQEITRIFSIMDMTATLWLGLKSLQSPAIMPLQKLGPVPFSLHHFLNIDEAASSLNYQITRLWQFRRWADFYSTSPEDCPPNAHARRHDFMSELEQWPMAMESLLKTMDQTALARDDQQRITVMQMNHQSTMIQNSLCMERPDQSPVRGRFETEYRDIITQAKSIVTPMDDSTRKRIERVVAANNQGINFEPLFSLYSGIVHPLYTVAINTTNLTIAREAVALLSTTPWREGAWDSSAMGRIAEKKIQQLLAEGQYDDGLELGFELSDDLPAQDSYDDAALGQYSLLSAQYGCDGQLQPPHDAVSCDTGDESGNASNSQ